MTSDTRFLPLFDLTRRWPDLRDEAVAVFEQIAQTGAFSLGAELEAFEQEYADYNGTRHAVGVANGTVAIELALRAVGAAPGSEVVTVPHTFIATVEAISATGARPVLVDVDPVTRTIDPNALPAVLGAATAAIVPVHLYGRVADMAGIAEHAPGVPLVEDCAQAHGSTLDGRRAGSFGAAGSFSFYPTKNLGAMGDAGAVVSDDEQVAAMVRSLRHHGSAPEDANRHERLGGTERLDNLQAALLRLKLHRLDRDNDDRRWAADRYRERLEGLPLALPPEDGPERHSVYHLFVVEVDDRDRVRARLRESGIGAGVHYPVPVHLQPGWRDLGYGPGDFPHAERLASRCLSLPCFPGIELDEIDHVADCVRRALA